MIVTLMYYMPSDLIIWGQYEKAVDEWEIHQDSDHLDIYVGF